MAIKFENTDIVKDIESRFSTKREQAVVLGVWDATLEKFKSGAPSLNLQTLESISDKAGWDVEISFVKRNKN